jgi:ketosteroid isomerase-like protein
MSASRSNLDIVKEYLAAIEAGAVGDALARFFTADVVQEELPNRLVPQGARRDLGGLLDSAARGQKVMSAQRYELLSSVESGDTVALEVRWTGTLAVPFGTLPAGGEMRARFAMFIELRAGKIARQRNYDCFDPW